VFNLNVFNHNVNYVFFKLQNIYIVIVSFKIGFLFLIPILTIVFSIDQLVDCIVYSRTDKNRIGWRLLADAYVTIAAETPVHRKLLLPAGSVSMHSEMLYFPSILLFHR
jgi:hypothetical protein